MEHTITSVMSLPLLYPKSLGNECDQLNIPHCYHIYVLYIMSFDITIILQRMQTL